MIKLKVSNKVKNVFKFIDFEVLESICNNITFFIANKIKTTTIKLQYSNTKESYYMFDNNVIKMTDIEESIKDKEYDFLKTFIHEFRHWVQDKILKVNYYRNYTDYNHSKAAYYKCPLEKDTRLFTKNSCSAIRSLYRNLKKVKRVLLTTHKTGVKFL